MPPITARTLLGRSDDCESYLEPYLSSPIVCLIDALVGIYTLLDIALSRISALVHSTFKRAQTDSQSNLTTTTSENTSTDSSPSSIMAVRITLFILGVLPACIKIFGIYGIPTSQSLAAVLLSPTVLAIIMPGVRISKPPRIVQNLVYNRKVHLVTFGIIVPHIIVYSWIWDRIARNLSIAQNEKAEDVSNWLKFIHQYCRLLLIVITLLWLSARLLASKTAWRVQLPHFLALDCSVGYLCFPGLLLKERAEENMRNRNLWSAWSTDPRTIPTVGVAFIWTLGLAWGATQAYRFLLGFKARRRLSDPATLGTNRSSESDPTVPISSHLADSGDIETSRVSSDAQDEIRPPFMQDVDATNQGCIMAMKSWTDAAKAVGRGKFDGDEEARESMGRFIQVLRDADSKGFGHLGAPQWPSVLAVWGDSSPWPYDRALDESEDEYAKLVDLKESVVWHVNDLPPVEAPFLWHLKYTQTRWRITTYCFTRFRQSAFAAFREAWRSQTPANSITLARRRTSCDKVLGSWRVLCLALRLGTTHFLLFWSFGIYHILDFWPILLHVCSKMPDGGTLRLAFALFKLLTAIMYYVLVFDSTGIMDPGWLWVLG